MPTLLPSPGDNEYVLLSKWLRNRGGVFRPGDSETDLWRKLVLLVAPSTQFHGDTETRLAQLFLAALGTTYLGRNYPLLLQNIVHHFGLMDLPSDNAWASLAKLVASGGGNPLPPGFSYLLDGNGDQILDGNGEPFIVIL